MPATTHSATFTWPGNSANTVFVTGAWDNWSGNSHALDKQSDGGFVGHVDLPFGQTYSYKYVVDGEWKTREDEAKEWDAAGNMNNVYTAPAESTEAVAASAPAAETAPATEASPAAEPTSSAAAPAAAAAAVPVAAAAAVASQHKSEPEVTEKTTVPSTTAPDSTVLSTEKSTEPETLLASSTPGPAASGTAALPASERGVAGAKEGENPSNPLAGFDLGAPIAGGGVSSAATSSFNATPIASTSTPVTIRASDSTAAVPIPGTAATSTTETANESSSYAAQAAAIGGGALAALGAGALAVGGAVEKATGIDVIHHPMSVEAAKSAGIDIKSLEKVDAPTHTTTGTSPVPASAVEALEEKIQAVKLDADKSVSSVTDSGPGKSVQHDVPLPSKPAPKTSLPPSGSILPPPKEDAAPKPDLHAQEDNAADHKSVPAPIIKTISPRDPAKDRTSPQTDKAGQADQPISTDPSVSAKDIKKEAEAPPAPPAKSTPAPAPTPAVVPAKLAATTPVAAPTPVDKPVAPAAPVQNPTAVAQAQGVPAASSQPPATPTKTAAAASVASPGSAMSTPAGTPQKSAHGREATTDSDKIRKRKSSFFSKIKERFSSSSPDKQK